MNVDQAELNKFSQTASMWWDPEGPYKPLHQLNPLRLAFVQNYAELEGKHVLDVGCGGGILTESLALSGAQARGLDLAGEVLEVAKLHSLEQKLDIDYVQVPIEEHAKDYGEQYDVVTCMEMLEHVPDPVSVLNAIFHTLKPGGKAFLSTINRNLKAYMTAIIGAEYVLNILPKGTHHYEKLIRPSELTAWCRHVGFTPKACEGIHYNVLKQAFESTSKLDVNYLVYVEKPK